MSLWKTVRSVFSELNFMALILYLSVATQGIASSYKQGAVNTIERRFYLNSRETGFIFGVYDGVFLVMLFVVSFYLDRARNRLVVVAVGVLVLATGLFTFSLPHYFVVGQNVSDIIRIEKKVALCSNESLSSNHTSTADKDWLHSFLWKCFLPGNILIALGSTPLYTTGVALLGQNGGQQSLYEPIFYCIAMLAPAIGMVINSKFLQLFINYGTPMPTWIASITYEDPQWLGAWWIGFLINSLIALVLACILFACAFCFRTLRLAPILKKSATVEKRLSELSHANANRCSRFAYRALHRMKLDEALHAVITLLGNSYFTFMSLYATTEFAANGSIANNLIKFLEIQFARPSSKVSMEVGITGLFAAVFGLPVGCYLNKRIGKHRLAIIKLDLVTACLHFALMFVFLWPCNNASKYAGIHLSYDAQFNPSTSSNLTATCNADCKCKHDQAHFAPVCAVNPNGETVTFLSACFAGCRSKHNDSYEDCSCLQGTTYQNATVGYGNSTCVRACNHVVFVYFMIFVAFFLSIATAIPNISSVLGCFPEQYKSVACSLQWLSLRLFGSITSSLIYAEFIKNACIFHVDASSDSACLLYDHALFGWAIGGPSLFYKSIGIVLVIIAFIFEVRHTPGKQPSLVDPNNNRQIRLLTDPPYAHDHSQLKDDAECSASLNPAAHDGELKVPQVSTVNGGHSSSPQTQTALSL